MLSILIPTYNYNIVPLVEELNQQCVTCGIDFEILAYDDGSKSELNTINNTINSLNNCIFKILPKNIGRSAIRNLLGNHAKYHLLLFIDADTFPENQFFIKNYILSDAEVINGSITCTETIPKKPYKLRWIYTKKREFHALCSSNFLIKKSIFKQYPFDETITTYGYEDVLFFETLKNNNIQVFKINNPLIHESLDDANTFVTKTELALKNLFKLINTRKLKTEDFKVSLLNHKLDKLYLVGFVCWLFKLTKPLLIKNFNSNNPSLFLFDFYKLGYFCILNKNKS